MNLLLNLFLAFLQIGACSIGGGYATISMIQQIVVQQHGWLSTQEYLDMITLSQMTPGPLAVNTSTFAGMRTAGIYGAIFSTIGCVLAGILLSLLLYRFFQKHRDNLTISFILEGLKSISCGLIMASAFTIIALAVYPNGVLSITSILITCITLILMRKYKLHPITIMILAGVLGLCFDKIL